MGNKFILGGGVTGLVLGHILKDYTILTDNIGGLQGKGFPLGPQILHDSPKVREFLKSLNIQAEPKVFNIGYVIDGKVTDTIGEAERQLYYNKTRGNGKEYEASSLSGGKNQITGYDIDKINLMFKLIQANNYRMRVFTAYEIDTRSKKINKTIQYKDLISTIDLQILRDIVIDSPQMYLKKNLVYFTKVAYNMDSKYDYMYFINDPVLNRITRLDDRNAVIESNAPIDRNQWMVIKQKPIHTQIKTPKCLESLMGIKLVGRFAQYDQSIKINDVIERWWK